MEPTSTEFVQVATRVGESAGILITFLVAMFWGARKFLPGMMEGATKSDDVVKAISGVRDEIQGLRHDIGEMDKRLIDNQIQAGRFDERIKNLEGAVFKRRVGDSE